MAFLPSVRSREMDLLAIPQAGTAGDDLSEFYTRLTKIKDYHRKYPDTPADPFAVELAGILGEEQLDEDQEDRKILFFLQ